MTRKPLADIIAEGEGHALGKALGPVSITPLGIGCIIGTGNFVLAGSAAARYAGPGVMLSIVIGGMACAFVGLRDRGAMRHGLARRPSAFLE